MEYYGVTEWAELERVFVLLFVLLPVHFFQTFDLSRVLLSVFFEKISSLVLFPAGVSPFMLALFGLLFLACGVHSPMVLFLPYFHPPSPPPLLSTVSALDDI